MTDTDAYRRHVDRANERSRKRTRSGQEVGRIPAVKNWPRRERCGASLVAFCNEYFPKQFRLAWSPYHFRAAEKIERAVTDGGLFAFAMPRASGKSTLSRAACLWAVLTGRARYVVLLGATEKKAEQALRAMKVALWRNDALLEDFPHAVHPIRKLDNESRACVGQRYKGEKTCVEWNQLRIVLPWIEHEHNLSCGAVIECMAMTGEIRGPLHTCPDGESIRPGLVLADDPQTRESARSPSQTQTRLDTLMGDVAYLSGPDEPIAVVCPCTVVYRDDLADKILNRELHPEWQGEKSAMVEKFPTNSKLWDQYEDILRSSLKADGDARAATEFYKANRAAMDEGAVVSWPERFKRGELSAIQSAMNLKIRNEAMFWAEAQNQPVAVQDDLEMLTAEEIARKATNWERGVIPPNCVEITAMTDIQQNFLVTMIVAWSAEFTGFIVDFFATPDQGRLYFTRRDARNRLDMTYGGDESGVTYAALTDIGDRIAGSPYTTEDGRELRLGRWCIDGGYASRVPATEAYVSQSPHKSIIAVTKGFGVKASERPLSESPRAIQQRTGPAWYWRDGKKDGGWVSFDANFWKKRVCAGLCLSTGSRGSISLFKAAPHVHQMLSEHLTAERGIRVDAKGRTVFEFTEIPGRDNEGLDCLVGCAVGASINGISRDSERITRKPRTEIKTPQEWAALARKRA